METSNSKAYQPKTKEQFAEDVKRPYAYWDNKYSTFISIIVIGFVVSSLGILMYLSVDIFKGLVSPPHKPTHEDDRMIAFTFMVLIGIILFILRKRQKFWYGVVETLFALVNSYFTADIFSSKFTSGQLDIYLTGFASVYLLIRGLTNLDEGLYQDFFQRERILTIRAFFRHGLLAMWYPDL